MMNTPTGPEKAQIQKMFASIAGGYDRANTVLSLGIHHLWRKKLVRLSGAKLSDRVLDCATGTGDLALEFKRTVGPTGKVLGTDFCPEMLEHAPAKAFDAHLTVDFEVADVTALPYDDNTFDIASISFGIRNVENPLQGLQELARVVKPGGRVMVLEFGQMSTPVVKQVYEFYSQRVLPKIGGIVTGKPDAYEYLQKSSSKFPSGDAFIELMKKTEAFSEVRFFPVSFGVAYIYKGTKK